MQAVARALVVLSLLVAGLLVIPGPVYGFDVPRLGIITTSLVAASLLLAPRVPPLVREATRTEHVVLAASASFVAWIVMLTLLGEVTALSWLGDQSRFVGGGALAAAPLLVLVLPLLVRNSRDVDVWLWLFTATLAAGAVYGVVQYAGLDPMPWAVERGGRPIGFYGNTNFVGAVLCMATPLAWWVWTQGRNWRIQAVALALTSWVAMYAASVRLGGIAAVAGAAVVGIGLLRLKDRRWQGWFLVAVPVGGVVAGSAAVAVGAAIGDGNGIARVSFWRTATRMWADAPLTGQGVGRFAPHYRLFRAPEEVTALGATERDLPVDTSHHLLFDLAATAGAPAAVLWLTVLVGVGLLLRNGWMAGDGPEQVRFLALAAALGAYTVQSAVSLPIITTIFLGWLLIGITLAASIASRRDRAKRGAKRKQRGRASARKKTVKNGADPLAIGATVLALVSTVALGTFSANVWLSTRDIGLSASALAQDVPEPAVSFAGSATERTAWWPEAWQRLSRAAAGADDASLAREAAERAVDADPLNREGRYRLIELDRAERDLEGVANHLAELRMLDPYGLDVHVDALGLSRVLEDDDLAAESLEIIEQVIDDDHPRWDEIQALR